MRWKWPPCYKWGNYGYSKLTWPRSHSKTGVQLYLTPMWVLFPLSPLALEVQAQKSSISTSWELLRHMYPQPLPKPTESETREVGPRHLCFNEPSRWFWCTLRFGNHCSMPCIPSSMRIQFLILYLTQSREESPWVQNVNFHWLLSNDESSILNKLPLAPLQPKMHIVRKSRN